MEIRFQPALLQEVIDSFIEKTEREGDPTYYKDFHENADPIYEKFTLDDREAEFKKLYQYLFGIWGFSDIIRDAFNEFPDMKEKIGIVLVKGVLKEDQEAEIPLQMGIGRARPGPRIRGERPQRSRHQADPPAILRSGADPVLPA